MAIFIPKPSVVKLPIYNRHKEDLQVLPDRLLDAGTHESSRDATSNNGKFVAEGNYYYSLEAEGFVLSRKLRFKSQ